MEAVKFDSRRFETSKLEAVVPRREGVIKLTEPFPTASIMAQFYLAGGGKLAKVYTTEDNIAINVRFSDPLVRHGVIMNEIAVGNALSPNYGGELALVQTPEGETQTAILMNKLDQRQNLLTQLQDGVMPDEETWRNIARQIAGAHFNPDIARQVDVGLFSNFIRQTMDDEHTLLLKRYQDKGDLIRQIYRSADLFVQRYASQIDRYCEITGEPVFTHGDEKPENMFLTGRKSMTVIDAVLRPDWAVNVRDLSFMLAELRILNLPEPGMILIDEYSTEYFRHLRERGVGEKQIEEVADRLPIINSLMSVYRLGILTRLADIHRMDQVQKDLRFQHLQEAGDKIARML